MKILKKSILNCYYLFSTTAFCSSISPDNTTSLLSDVKVAQVTVH
jgi:hypothetical protein